MAGDQRTDETSKKKRQSRRMDHQPLATHRSKVTTEHNCTSGSRDRYPERELPRSACVGCPYHSNSEWKYLKENDPRSFSLRQCSSTAPFREMPHLRELSKGTAYLHHTRQPLDEVDFTNTKDYAEAMQEECEGLCGI